MRVYSRQNWLRRGALTQNVVEGKTTVLDLGDLSHLVDTYEGLLKILS
jgi:hypothetical protein